MPQVPTRTLRDYLASLAAGPSAAVVGQNLNLRTDLATMSQAVPAGGTTGQVLAKVNGTDYNIAWTTAGVGDMLKAVYDPTNINASPFVRANQTGTQPVGTITGLASVATSGSYADLSDKPTFLAPRSSTVGTTSTLTPAINLYDLVAVSAQAGALTIAAPTGTALDGQILTIRIRDNGTTRALTWNAVYSGYASDLPAATVVSKTMVYQFMWNASQNVWDLFSGNPIPGKWGA